MSCPVCGAHNEAGAAFCYRCGSALKQGAPTTGATVNLGRSDTPAPGTPVVPPQDEQGARVYDLPPSPATAPLSASDVSAASASAPDVAQYSVPQYSVPQYNVPQPPGGAVVAQQPNSNSALISMILGIVSLSMFLVLLCTIFLMPLSAALGIPAVIVGRNAQKEIRASGGQLGGAGMAQAGIIMGWISIALSVLSALAICGFLVLAASQS